MASKSLTFDIFGRDRTASKAIRGVGDSVDHAAGRFSGFKVAAGIALAAVGAAAGRFAVDSVKAYAEAEEAQIGLEDGLKRFPRLADTNIGKLRELNTALMEKTRFDDDAIASGQTVLAQYELSGQQLEELTPLLLDYAQKTGKDLPTAAEALGKAILGQGRALKDIGIDFQDTGTAAGNFDQLVGALRGQVGGFAEESAGTAAGKLDVLTNKFGEMQEAVGAELTDPLITLMDTISDSGAVEGTATAVGDIATAFSDLEKETGWIGDFADDLGQVQDMIDDIKAASEALGSGDFTKMGDWAAEEFGEGGIFGSIFGGEWFKNPPVPPLPENLRGMFGEAETETETGAENMRRGMGGGMSAMSGDISVFDQGTRGTWSGMFGDLEGRTSSGFGTIGGTTAGGVSGLGTTMGGLSPLAGTAFGSAFALAQALTGSGWGGVDGRTRAGMGTVGSTMGGFRGVVEGPFAGASGWLISAGGNIVRGLVSGIGSMVGTAARAAAELAANVVEGAKSALGIQSPSTVFREIGEFVGQGFELGVNDMQPSVRASIDAMVATPSVKSAVREPAATTYNQTFNMQPIRDNDPVTTATILGREFARRVAG